MKRFLTVAVAMATLTGCAQTYQPVVDTKGHDSARYQQDLFECRQYAEQVSPAGKAAVSGLGGAAAGAALGAITGALVGGVSAGSGAALGAATGGAVGVGAGAYSGVQEQERIINNCMRGRGYNVLN
jgi:outer membrane lipoprotein SlyB